MLAVNVESSAMRLLGLVTACPRATARHDNSTSTTATCRGQELSLNSAAGSTQVQLDAHRAALRGTTVREHGTL